MRHSSWRWSDVRTREKAIQMKRITAEYAPKAIEWEGISVSIAQLLSQMANWRQSYALRTSYERM